jgi:putative hydrolase of the HAD superfamily
MTTNSILLTPDFHNVRVVVFDAVGTLIHPRPSASEVYERVGRWHGSKLSAEQIRPRFADALVAEDEQDRRFGFRTDETREAQRWRNIVAEVLDDVPDPESVFQELFVHFAQPSAWVLNPEITAEPLRSSLQRYRLGVASNYDRRLYDVVAGIPALPRIEHIVVSSEIGWRKPAPAFFEALVARFQVQAHNILFVGDQLDIDYQAAIDAGLQALLFDPSKQHLDGPVARISTLSEIADVLPSRSKD